MTTITKIVLACAALAAATSALAQKAGDNIVSVGFASINPDTNVGPLSSTGVDATSNFVAGRFNTANQGLRGSIGAQTTVSFGWLHMYSDNIGAELSLGIPPKLTLDLQRADGTTEQGAATVKSWTPAVIAKYFFNTPQDKIRPYVGLGVSHVSFKDVTPSAAESIQALAGNGASMKSTWTPVYNAGVVYNIDEKWSVIGSVAYLPVRTTATFLGKTGYVANTLTPANGVTTKSSVGLDTMDYVVRLGYRF
jgi:outer membrane protein